MSHVTKKLDAFLESMSKILCMLRLSAGRQLDAPKAAGTKQPKVGVPPTFTRQSPRFQMRRPVYFSGDDLEGEGEVVNISLHGCAIESAVRVRREALLQLEITLFDEEAPLVVAHTRVAWAREGQFGVQFTNMEPASVQYLQRYVSSLMVETRWADLGERSRKPDEAASDTSDHELGNLLQAFELGVRAMKKLVQRDIANQVNERKRLANSLGLGGRLLQMYQEFEHLSERHRPLLEQWGCVVSDPPAERKEQGNVIALTLNHTGYSLRFRESSRFADEHVYANLDLCDASGDLLFSVLVEVEVNKSMSDWVQRAVEAFVPGDWVKDILTLSTALAAHLAVEEAHSREMFEIQQTEELKKRFGLD